MCSHLYFYLEFRFLPVLTGLLSLDADSNRLIAERTYVCMIE
jgi:hypothetical protein